MWYRRQGPVVTASLAALGGMCFLLGGCHVIARHALLAVVRPPGAFAAATVPPSPDYGDASAWAALPESRDNADIAPPGALPEAQSAAPADCFFVHGTTWANRAGWNEPPGDRAADGYTDRDVLPGQAGAFNAACRVYAPRYRQANLYAFVDARGSGAAALDLAYSDVARAFDAFLARTGSDRPFVLAGHSQGSALLLRLLVERLAGTPLMSRLVAAYLPGWSIDDADLATLRDMPLCDTAERVGCLATWNSEGEAPHGQLIDLTRSDTACVNPLSWQVGAEWAHATSSQVSWRYSSEGGLPPPAVASVVDARCADGALVVTPPSDRRFRNGFAEDALLGREVYHGVDYALFYGSIRENAVVRVQAWQAEHPAQ